MHEIQEGYLDDDYILDGLEAAGESHPLAGIAGSYREVNSPVPLPLLDSGKLKVLVHIRDSYSVEEFLEDLRVNDDARVQEAYERLKDVLPVSGGFERRSYVAYKSWPPCPFDDIAIAEK